jgi:hypothetical protein
LYRAQTALTALSYLTHSFDENTDPPPDFGFGLSTILDHINDDVMAAYNEYTKPEEAVRPIQEAEEVI